MQLKNVHSLPQRLVMWENPAVKMEAKWNLCGKGLIQKVWGCYEETFLLSNRKVFETFGTDNFELGHQCRDPRSQACFVALEQPQCTIYRSGPSVHLEVHEISCLRLFEISSEPSGLSTTILPDTLLLTGQGVPLHSVCWDRFLLTENWGFQINSLWNDRMVLSFHQGMLEDCESAAFGNDGSQDTTMKLIPVGCTGRLYQTDFMAYDLYFLFLLCSGMPCL